MFFDKRTCYGVALNFLNKNTGDCRYFQKIRGLSHEVLTKRDSGEGFPRHFVSAGQP